GRLPMPPNPKVVKKVIGDQKIIEHRPADDIAPELEKYKEQCAEYIEKEEDILTYALFPQLAVIFFKNRQAAKYKVDTDIYTLKTPIHPV
ncbi:MAG: oxaloacetate decarboxylase subunit alpha, partial [Clostridiales bacterium]|nr:oxaloacetate decarboxylase subunit alpha [Clostridiales bacterium]